MKTPSFYQAQINTSERFNFSFATICLVWDICQEGRDFLISVHTWPSCVFSKPWQDKGVADSLTMSIDEIGLVQGGMAVDDNVDRKDATLMADCLLASVALMLSGILTIHSLSGSKKEEFRSEQGPPDFAEPVCRSSSLSEWVRLPNMAYGRLWQAPLFIVCFGANAVHASDWWMARCFLWQQEIPQLPWFLITNGDPAPFLFFFVTQREISSQLNSFLPSP